MKEGIYGKIDTSKGSILVSLTYEETPGTVGNFVCLAEGLIKNSAKSGGKPYYDGLNFHRVVENFMIQGGCPNGDGKGGPGYSFDDEFHNSLRHDRAGVLSMANSGPNTNGSQFFITQVATEWLDDKHTVFGNVEKGQDVVDSIEQGDAIESIEIIRVGNKADKWDALVAFETFNKNALQRNEGIVLSEEKKIKEITEGFEKTSEGLYYKITKLGKGKKAKSGQPVSVHYTGMLINGDVFDSSIKRNSPISFLLGKGQVIPGWDIGISLLNEDSEAKLVIPPNLAYGSAGARDVIPPNATLIFEVKLVSVG
ncbi:peptidyl-prolyl cis-trans isomerase [Elysia marginata]|uniref:peptidylprolyl isomerase n=1 Tax=Elysia marginata TaxID=1093978 RepID=A0AAV4FMN2_9GAST|nr:peptidyl-prolyl cis-trans isomerase [Elysia marginata]